MFFKKTYIVRTISTYRVQPLDTNFNAHLQRMLSDQLQKCLGESCSHDERILPIFCPVWPKMKQKRSLIIDGFNDCGLYPFRNPATAADVNAGEAFENPLLYLLPLQTTPQLLQTPRSQSQTVQHFVI